MFGLGQFQNQQQQQALQGLVPGLNVGGSTVNTTNTQPMERNGLTGALGGAATGFGIGGPVGALGGGLIGLFG